MDVLMNIGASASHLLIGTLYLGAIFSVIYAILFYIPKRLNEIEKRVKKLEDKEKQLYG